MSSESLVGNVIEAEFELDVLQSEKLVLVDFWAEWCQPCRAIAVLLEEVAKEMPSVRVFKADVDGEPGLAQRFGVYNVPTLLFFKGGKQVDQIIGSVAKKVLVEKIDAAIAA